MVITVNMKQSIVYANKNQQQIYVVEASFSNLTVYISKNNFANYVILLIDRQ